MKLFRSAMLFLGETAAFGWFLLRGISPLAVLPLIPLGVAFYALHPGRTIRWLNGVTAVLSALLVAYVVSVGVFDGKGFFTLLLLLPATALIGIGAPKREIERVSGWWMAAFLMAFIVMLVATLPGIHLPDQVPTWGGTGDILIFYLLAFAEPLSLGKSYRAGPLALGMLLLPFGMLSYLALGSGAFSMAEFPYLSVWAGVSVSAFHHVEGIILCLYYGAGALRLSHFLQYCCQEKTVLM